MPGTVLGCCRKCCRSSLSTPWTGQGCSAGRMGAAIMEWSLEMSELGGVADPSACTEQQRVWQAGSLPCCSWWLQCMCCPAIKHAPSLLCKRNHPAHSICLQREWQPQVLRAACRTGRGFWRLSPSIHCSCSLFPSGMAEPEDCRALLSQQPVILITQRLHCFPSPPWSMGGPWVSIHNLKHPNCLQFHYSSLVALFPPFAN